MLHDTETCVTVSHFEHWHECRRPLGASDLAPTVRSFDCYCTMDVDPVSRRVTLTYEGLRNCLSILAMLRRRSQVRVVTIVSPRLYWR